MSSSALPDVLGSVAGFLTTVAFLPQVLRTWRTRSTRDISLGMFLLFSLGVGLWTVYGMVIGSWPVIVSNVVTLLLAGSILVAKLLFSGD